MGRKRKRVAEPKPEVILAAAKLQLEREVGMPQASH